MHTGDDASARALARRCNEFSAELVKDHPGRFAGFACLPLPDVDGALLELSYALDELNHDIRISPVLRSEAGAPWARTFVQSMNYGTQTLFAEPFGSRRLPNITVFDVPSCPEIVCSRVP